MLVDSIPSVGIPDVVWTAEDQDGYVWVWVWVWVNEIFPVINEAVRLGGIAVLAATALIVLCVIWLGLVLRPAFAAPALRSSFGIDSTLLILVFAVGGALAVGATAGVFTAVALIPWAMDRLAEVLGGPRSVLAFEGSVDQADVVSG